MLVYVAYPTSLTLQSANAIQTYHTVRALQDVTQVALLVPRFLHRPTRFSDLGAIHLPRIPINALRNLVSWPLWADLERVLFAWEVIAYLKKAYLRHSKALYVRDVVVAGIVAPWAKERNLTVVYELHHLEAENPWRRTSRSGQGLGRLYERRTMQSIDGLVTLTQAAAADAVAQWPRLAGRYRVVPDAYDEALFVPRPREVARQYLGLASEDFLAAYVGLTFAHRSVELMLEAARILRDRSPVRVALVGGSAKERSNLVAFAEKLGLKATDFILPGKVALPEVPWWMAAADALVLTGVISDTASSPLKLFEYMAMGRPIVAADSPAVREVVDSASCLLFPPKRAESLAQALLTLKEDPALRAKMGSLNLERSKQYTYRARAEAIWEFVVSLLP